MEIPVIVSRENGHYVASLLGNASVRAEGATREVAVASLSSELSVRANRGELVWIPMPRGTLQLGSHEFAPEETADFREMVEDIYRARDEQKADECQA